MSASTEPTSNPPTPPPAGSTTRPDPFTVGLDATSLHGINGKVEGRCVLTVGGEQKVIERITLDSNISRGRAAKRWSERFGVDHDAVLDKLNATCMSAIARYIENRERRARLKEDSDRVSILADKFIAGLNLEWHRDGKIVYSAKAERALSIGTLWTLADDDMIDAVGRTREGFEAGELSFRGRIGMFKDAVLMAAARAIKTLPEWVEIEQDKTVNADNLIAHLVAWLLTTRTFRTDTGTPITMTYYGWACGLEIGGGWQQCFTSSVFGRFDEGDSQPQIAVTGAVLAKELRAESSKKLAADLRKTGLMTTDNVARVTGGKPRRVWIVTPKTLDAIVSGEADA